MAKATKKPGVYLLKCKVCGYTLEIKVVNDTGFLPVEEVRVEAERRDWEASLIHQDEDYCPIDRPARI